MQATASVHPTGTTRNQKPTCYQPPTGTLGRPGPSSRNGQSGPSPSPLLHFRPDRFGPATGPTVPGYGSRSPRPRFADRLERPRTGTGTWASADAVPIAHRAIADLPASQPGDPRHRVLINAQQISQVRYPNEDSAPVICLIRPARLPWTLGADFTAR